MIILDVDVMKFPKSLLDLEFKFPKETRARAAYGLNVRPFRQYRLRLDLQVPARKQRPALKCLPSSPRTCRSQKSDGRIGRLSGKTRGPRGQGAKHRQKATRQSSRRAPGRPARQTTTRPPCWKQSDRLSPKCQTSSPTAATTAKPSLASSSKPSASCCVAKRRWISNGRWCPRVTTQRDSSTSQ